MNTPVAALEHCSMRTYAQIGSPNLACLKIEVQNLSGREDLLNFQIYAWNRPVITAVE